VLKELGKADWMRMLNIPESRIPFVLILRGTRNLQSQYETTRSFFSNSLEVGAPNGIIEHVFIGDLQGRSVGFACVYGAPMTAEIVHIFGVLGTRAVIQTGNCGALADGLRAGDLFVPTEAFCGEGAAQYYKPNGQRAAAFPNFFDSDTCKRHGVEHFHGGAIYTTAALLAEGEADIERWHQQGFAAVDMETATAFAVAEYFGMLRAAILYVFDNPRRREHLLLSDTEKDVRRDQANKTVRELAFALALELDEGIKEGRLAI
jgi:uridine phosphorylase